MSPLPPARIGIAALSALATGALALGLLAPADASALAHLSSTQPTARSAASTLRLGSRGSPVRSLQSTLARLTYLPHSGVDGVFGLQTWHAVVAFQGWNHLTRDGVVGEQTRRALSDGRQPRPWSTAAGLEIHIAQQVLLVITGGHVIRAIHVSTGASGATPVGHFRVYRRDPMSWSYPFHVWMPLAQYFSGGFAMHEFRSVPAYPVSHGCVRIPASESRFVWQFGRIGMRVWTRR